MNRNLSITVVLVASIVSAHANPTGNPGADGWQAGGNSMSNGTYIRGAGNYGFTTYVTEMTLAAGHQFNAVGSQQWNVGDQVIGIGGVIDFNTPIASANGWGAGSSYTGSATNVNLQSSSSGTRMVSKFGTTASAWGPSTVAPSAGNGLGSASSGHGGNGAVTIANSDGDFPGTPSGTLRLPSVMEIYNGTSSINLSSSAGVEAGRLVYNWSVINSFNIITSWEAFINVTMLNAMNGTASLNNNSFADLPMFGDRHNIAIQRGTSSTLFTDALVQANPIPEPTTMAALGLGAAAVLRRRRKSDC